LNARPELLGWPAQAGLCAAAFFAITAEALIGMLLPLWALERGLGAERLGVLVALGSIVPMVLAPGVGALCDRYGDRRVLIVTAAGTCASALLYAPAPGYLAACAVQLLGGLTRSTGWVAAQSYAVRRVPEVQRARVMGRFSFAGSVGMLVAPLLAGALVAHGGVRAGFWLLAAWGGGLVVVGLLLPAQRPGAARGSVLRVTVSGYARMVPMLAQPALAIIMILTLLRLGAAAVNASFYPVYLAQAGLGSAAIGAMFAAINGAVSVGSLTAAALVRRLGVGPLLVGAIALATVAVCAVPLTTRPWLIACLSALHGLGLGLSLPTLLTAIGTATPVHERGQVIGLRTVFNRLGYLVVPVGLGFLAARMGLAQAFAVIGGCLLGLLALTVWAARALRIRL
jgi:MFS family permease